MCLNFLTPYDKNNDSNDKNNDSTGFWLLQCQNIIVVHVFCQNFNSELLHTFGLMSWYDVNTDKKK